MRHFDIGRQLIARGHELTLVSSSVGQLGKQYESLAGMKRPRTEMVDGIRFVWLPALTYSGNTGRRLVGMLDTAWRVWRGQGLANLARPDVIVASSPHPFAAFGALHLSRRLKVPFVVEIRDVWPASITTAGRLGNRHPLIVALSWMERQLYRGAREIITLLPGTPAHIERCGGHPARITIIPNGVDLARFGPSTAQPAHDGLRIVYMGTVGLWYGLDTAIDAMELIKELPEARDISLTFIGGGAEEPRLKAECEARGLSAIRFLGRIPKSEVPTRLAEYDACLGVVKNAPLYNEGGISMNKLFDYLAAGRPILLSSSAYNDPVADGKAGMSSPGGDPAALADNILRMATLNRRQRADLGRAGRFYVEEMFNFDLLSSQFERVLDRALNLDVTPVSHPAITRVLG